MRAQVISGIAPAQLIGIDFDPFKFCIIWVNAFKQRPVALCIGFCVRTVPLILAWIRQLNALREVKPELLAFRNVRKNAGVKQQVIVIRFTARDCIC